MITKLKKVIYEASKIMLSASDINNNTISKSDRNYVTVYDTKVQQYIQDKLKEHFPDVHFIGEEGDSEKIDFNNSKCFILDPIDGTANFRREYRYSAISLAYVEYGIVKCGLVYNPYNDELFYAQRGHGAYLNDKLIKASCAHLKNSFVCFGTAPYYPELAEKTLKALPDIFRECEDLRRTGSAALDLAYIACGRHDVFFELSLFPWDFAASIVIIEEAGGIITDLNGKTPILFDRTPIIAGNKNAYKEFVDKNYFI